MSDNAFDRVSLPAAVGDLRRIWDEGALRARLAAAEGDDEVALWTRGLAQHNLAALGVRGAAARAERALKRLRELRPDHALALAYLGNVAIMAARDSFNFVGKPAMVRAGLAHLDHAVELAPDHVAIRLLRAGSGKRLPKLFDRRGHVLDDLRCAAALLEASGEDPDTLAEVYRDLDEVAEGSGGARGNRPLPTGGSR